MQKDLVRRLGSTVTVILSLLTWPSSLHAGSGVFDCRDKTQPNITICENSSLRADIVSIEKKIAVFKTHGSPVARFLSDDYLRYFHVEIWSTLTGESGLSELLPRIQSVLDRHKAELSVRITKEGLIRLIKEGGYVDAPLAKMFPNVFLNFVGKTCGSIDVTPLANGRFTGIFRDCVDNSVVELSLIEANQKLFDLVAVHPSFLSWFSGRFEKQNGTLWFVMGPSR